MFQPQHRPARFALGAWSLKMSAEIWEAFEALRLELIERALALAESGK